MKPLALVIEDDPAIREALGDRLDSLGHDHHCVGCLNEARERLGRCSYTYILLDLELPVRFGRPPSIPVGKNLLLEIRKNPRHADVPVLVVTAHGHDRPDLAVEVMKAGASDFVKKPFDNLDHAIREALSASRNGFEVPSCGGGNGDDQVLRSLDGEKLVFLRNRIELAGVTVCTPDNGVIWRILFLLRERRPDGRPRAIPGKAIADHLSLDRGQNAVCDAVSAFRRKLIQILENEQIAATEDSLIVTGRAGYQIHSDLTVEDGSELEAEEGIEPETVSAQDRQAWFLQQLQSEGKARRRDLERQFRISEATAKRDLRAVSEAVEFVGTGESGFYRSKKTENVP
jgi:DNA-binding response OmpR family regulator